MKTLTVEQQIAALRPALGFAVRMHWWLLVGAALGVIAAIVFWHPVPLMIAVFLTVVGISEQRAGPNIVAALTAYDTVVPTYGEILIAITCWDTDNHYHATVLENGCPDWVYEFIPQGWQPATRSYPAKIWRTANQGQPVLAVVEEGIMIPRYEPKPMEKQS